MPRYPLVKELSARIRDKPGTYLVIYDFELGGQGKIPTRFYLNLKRLSVKTLQKSVIMCSSLKTAVTVANLVKHYGGKAQVFEIKKVIFT